MRTNVLISTARQPESLRLLCGYVTNEWEDYEKNEPKTRMKIVYSRASCTDIRSYDDDDDDNAERFANSGDVHRLSRHARRIGSKKFTNLFLSAR